MTPEEGNIELLTQAVMSEARADADQLLAEARSKAESIRRQAEEQAAAERKALFERAAQDADRIRRQATATAEIKARMLQLEHREKMLADVFDAARKQLPGVQRWKEYEEIVNQLLREGLIKLGTGTANIHADEHSGRLLTKKKLDLIGKELNMKLSLKKPLSKGTGILVETTDGRMHYDNTLETRMELMQSTLRSPVYKILMGEGL
jgi:vacuolar-type H+-ATPase subunit E/Vma4